MHEGKGQNKKRKQVRATHQLLGTKVESYSIEQKQADRLHLHPITYKGSDKLEHSKKINAKK